MDIKKLKVEFERSECFKRLEHVAQYTFFEFGAYIKRTDVPADIEKKCEHLITALIFSWKAWREAKAQAVPDLGELQERIAGHQYYHDEHGHMVVDMDDVVKEISSFDSCKSQAVPEGRTDSEIIDQTIQLVDLLASANRFQRDKSKPFPFESKNPRNMEWWRLACQIQELITDTDPNNCDFEEYKAMIEAQEPAND